MVLRVQGGACAACGPAVDPLEPRPSPHNATVRVWWASSSDDQPGWRAVHEAADNRGVQKTQKLKVEAVLAAESPNTVDIQWVEALAPAALHLLGDDDLPVVARAWQPVHCRILDGLATLLELFWNEIVTEARGASCIVVRLTGLPPLVSALLPELVFRGLRETEHGVKSMTELIRLLRSTGPVLCALTGHVTACSDARRRLGEVPDTPTPESVEHVVLALSAASGLASLSQLLGPPPARERALFEPDTADATTTLRVTEARAAIHDADSRAGVPEPGVSKTTEAGVVEEGVGGGVAGVSAGAPPGGRSRVVGAAAGAGGGLIGTRKVLDSLGEAPSAPSAFGRR
jgi:hypothetical protein